MRLISLDLSHKLIHQPVAFPFRRDAKHFVKFTQPLDFLSSINRWLNNPWSLYVILGADTSFELSFIVEPQYSWMFGQPFELGLRALWNMAAFQQPNNVFLEVAGGLAQMRDGDFYGDLALLRSIKLLTELKDNKELTQWAATLDRDIYLQSGNWAAVRLAAKHRGNWQCATCGGSRFLEVHHRSRGAYERLGHEKAADLTVLCNDHHAQFHDKPPKRSSIEQKFRTPPQKHLL